MPYSGESLTETQVGCMLPPGYSQRIVKRGVRVYGWIELMVPAKRLLMQRIVLTEPDDHSWNGQFVLTC